MRRKRSGEGSVAKELLENAQILAGKINDRLHYLDLLMAQLPSIGRTARTRCSGFTLAEVVISLVIVATVFSGIVMAYIQAARRAEWTGRSLAAQALNIQLIEQARSARWNLGIGGVQPVDEIAGMTDLLAYSYSGGNLSGYTWTNLDLPSFGTNYVTATNYLSIRPVTLSGGATIRVIRVDTVWPFTWRKTIRYFTNTLCTYASPDN
jgi:prepilin-type N-terminal cleavage/methylation domain-containing protein